MQETYRRRHVSMSARSQSAVRFGTKVSSPNPCKPQGLGGGGYADSHGGGSDDGDFSSLRKAKSQSAWPKTAPVACEQQSSVLHVHGADGGPIHPAVKTTPRGHRRDGFLSGDRRGMGKRAKNWHQFLPCHQLFELNRAPFAGSESLRRHFGGEFLSLSWLAVAKLWLVGPPLASCRCLQERSSAAQRVVAGLHVVVEREQDEGHPGYRQVRSTPS